MKNKASFFKRLRATVHYYFSDFHIYFQKFKFGADWYFYDCPHFIVNIGFIQVDWSSWFRFDVKKFYSRDYE